MELTEVEALHVAVPVFGVLICAFLVFAFGFKSPAQPPSFNFDEDGKKKKPKKAKQQKSQTNGHVTAVTPESSLPIKSQPSPKHVDKPAKSSSPGNKTGKKAEVQTKKAKKTKEDVTVVPVPATTKLKMEEDGWTTQVSRKDRKLKNKKEDKNDSGEEAEVKVTQVEEAPLEQRSKGKNKKKSPKEAAEAKEEAKTVSKAPEPIAKAAEVVSKAPASVTKAPETSAGAKDSAGEAAEAPFESPSKKNKGRKAAAGEAVKDQVDSAVKPSSPAATKKGKAKSPSPDKPATENAEPKVSEASKSKSPSPDLGKPKIKDVKPAPEAAKPKSPGAGKDNGAKDSPSGDSKPVKSPKNKKKNEKTTDTVVKETPQPVTEVAQPSVTETPAASSSTTVEGAGASAEAPQVVAFDEMGLTADSWTEAKPKGKKKKPRREN